MSKTKPPSILQIERACSEKKLLSQSDDSHTQEYLSWAEKTGKEFSDRYPTWDFFKQQSRHKSCFSRIVTKLAEYCRYFINPKIASIAIATASLCLVFSIVMLNHNQVLTMKGSDTAFLFVNGNRVNFDTIPIICSAGDTLQIGTTHASAIWYFLLYADDAGALQSYMPDSCIGKNKLSSNKKNQLLPYSIVLDSLWNEEKVYCVLSKTNVTSERAFDLVERVRNNQNDQTNEGRIYQWTLLRK
jgi:hypothetical protein